MTKEAQKQKTTLKETSDKIMVRRIFIPKELEDKKSLFLFGTMSKRYWDFATEMESKALSQLKLQLNSFYVFPTIIFYCASFDALLNEGLTNLIASNVRKEDEVNCIKNVRDVVKRIRISAIFLDKKQRGIIKESILNEYKALTELRNAVVHYNPEFSSIFHYPQRLKESFVRSKTEPVKGGDWVTTFETKVVLIWAKTTAKKMIDCFLGLQQMDKKEFFEGSTNYHKS